MLDWLLETCLQAKLIFHQSIHFVSLLLVRVVVAKEEEATQMSSPNILFQFLFDDPELLKGRQGHGASQWWLRNDRSVKRVHRSTNIGDVNAGALTANAN